MQSYKKRSPSCGGHCSVSWSSILLVSLFPLSFVPALPRYSHLRALHLLGLLYWCAYYCHCGILEGSFIGLGIVPAWIGKFGVSPPKLPELRAEFTAGRSSCDTTFLKFKACRRSSATAFLKFVKGRSSSAAAFLNVGTCRSFNVAGNIELPVPLPSIHYGIWAVREFRLCAHPPRHRGRQGLKDCLCFLPSTSTSGSNRRVPPPRGFLLAAHPWASPSGSSTLSLVPFTSRNLMPKFAACGPVSRLGPLSLLLWVVPRCAVRLFAGSTFSGAGGCVFPSAIDFVFGDRFPYFSSFVYLFCRDCLFWGGRTCSLVVLTYVLIVFRCLRGGLKEFNVVLLPCVSASRWKNHLWLTETLLRAAFVVCS